MDRYSPTNYHSLNTFSTAFPFRTRRIFTSPISEFQNFQAPYIPQGCSSTWYKGPLFREVNNSSKNNDKNNSSRMTGRKREPNQFVNFGRIKRRKLNNNHHTPRPDLQLTSTFYKDDSLASLSSSFGGYNNNINNNNVNDGNRMDSAVFLFNLKPYRKSSESYSLKFPEKLAKSPYKYILRVQFNKKYHKFSKTRFFKKSSENFQFLFFRRGEVYVEDPGKVMKKQIFINEVSDCFVSKLKKSSPVEKLYEISFQNTSSKASYQIQVVYMNGDVSANEKKTVFESEWFKIMSKRSNLEEEYWKGVVESKKRLVKNLHIGEVDEIGNT